MRICIALLLLIFSVSCSKDIYGTYNNRNSSDKSAFFQIKLNPNNSIEKTEIHTIKDFSSGTFVKKNNDIICYLDFSSTGFPKDTIVLKIKGNKLFFKRNNKINKKQILFKE